MNGFSLLATIISVSSFPLAFLAVLYPQVASPKGRWRGFFFYLSLSGMTLLLAALTAPNSNATEERWSLIDWTVFLVGGGVVFVWLTKKWWLKWWKTRSTWTPSKNSEGESQAGIPSNKKKKRDKGYHKRGEGKEK